MTEWRTKDGGVQLFCSDCLVTLPALAENSVDAVVTDPPYGLNFMGHDWDHSVPGIPFWKEILRVVKPGAHLLAFGGTRTFHRLMCAIEDAGWEIRDTVMWVHGQGFPKSLDVSKAIDKAAGVKREVAGRAKDMGKQNPEWNGTAKGRSENYFMPEYDVTVPATDAAKQWDGWGTALKPAWEPVILARKPLEGSVAENIQKWGTGAINIDGCRIQTDELAGKVYRNSGNNLSFGGTYGRGTVAGNAIGRYPANLVHDGSEEVTSLFPINSPSIMIRNQTDGARHFNNEGKPTRYKTVGVIDDPGGSAARFFYCAKADHEDRDRGCISNRGKTQEERTGRAPGSPGLVMPGRVNNPYAGNSGVQIQHNSHPTVKPTDLMRYLCRLVTPPNGVILDPFMGSGSTGKAAVLEGFRFLGIELEQEWFEIARLRIEYELGLSYDDGRGFKQGSLLE